MAEQEHKRRSDAASTDVDQTTDDGGSSGSADQLKAEEFVRNYVQKGGQ